MVFLDLPHGIWLEVLDLLKNAMTSSGIEPAIFRLVVSPWFKRRPARKAGNLTAIY
jgi:hypothetical protein